MHAGSGIFKAATAPVLPRARAKTPPHRGTLIRTKRVVNAPEASERTSRERVTTVRTTT
jgi:hypothetical protein